ncbi:hypothetical protein Hanom_Chr02g00154371 [Helianthus anomalus]
MARPGQRKKIGSSRVSVRSTTINWRLVQIMVRISFGWFGFATRSKSVTKVNWLNPSQRQSTVGSTGQTLVKDRQKQSTRDPVKLTTPKLVLE